MKGSATRTMITVVMLMCFHPEGMSQETVFGLFRNDTELADDYFAEGQFQHALELYLNAEKRDSAPSENLLKIARCYFALRQYKNAIHWYDKHLNGFSSFTLRDIFNYAEAQAGVKDYEKAIAGYKQYLDQKPDDGLVIKKVWQLQNAHFLFEDSIHYAVRPIHSDSGLGELCPTLYGKGIVFMSNRRSVKIIDKIDAKANAPFYKLYYAERYQDTITFTGSKYLPPVAFDKGSSSKYHEGPIRFFDKQQRAVYVSTSAKARADGTRTLQLFFAERIDGRWKKANAFPFNSVEHSISDPAINETGTVLYFTSDKKGGFGGKDIYRSELVNGKWADPLNLGDQINTPYDEEFPYLHSGNVLYFSSNGHAGLGGLDLFKAPITPGGGFGDVTNLGYPLNTNFDEFGIVVDSLSTHGYITSNRKQGGLNDDIYEFDMDVQTYPLVLSGIVKFKQFSWSDSSELKPLAHARLHVIDNIRNVMVDEYTSDAEGHFSINIPYFSKYKIKVVGADNEENVVSLEIPKHRKAEGKHEIVVVKDPFREEHTEILR